jgi:hypothetical protein
VNGSIAGNLQVDAGAKLKGSGTIAGDATISCIHCPRNSPGLHGFSNLRDKSALTALLEFSKNSTSSRGMEIYGINVGVTSRSSLVRWSTCVSPQSMTHRHSAALSRRVE